MLPRNEESQGGKRLPSRAPADPVIEFIARPVAIVSHGGAQGLRISGKCQVGNSTVLYCVIEYFSSETLIEKHSFWNNPAESHVSGQYLMKE